MFNFVWDCLKNALCHNLNVSVFTDNNESSIAKNRQRLLAKSRIELVSMQ